MSNNKSSQKQAPLAGLGEQRRRVIGRLFGRAALAFQRQAVERIRARGFEDYRLADNGVLVHLQEEGNRITDLAERAGMTRQAMSQLVQRLEGLGYICKKPDPQDGRAQIVLFTERGEQLLRVGVEVVQGLDAEYSAILGEERHEAIRAGLLELLETIDPQGF